jgi:intraflagellar transport protein 56
VFVCVRVGCAAIVAGKEDQSALRDVMSMLRNTSNPQVEYIVRIMVKWAKENAVDVDR